MLKSNGKLCFITPNSYFNSKMGFEMRKYIAENKMLKEELISLNIANEETVFIASHITHNKAGTHEEIEEIFKGTA